MNPQPVVEGDVAEALRELLKQGSHEGPCDNGSAADPWYVQMYAGPCSLHLAAAERRREHAQTTLAAWDAATI